MDEREMEVTRRIRERGREELKIADYVERNTVTLTRNGNTNAHENPEAFICCINKKGRLCFAFFLFSNFVHYFL